MIKELLIGLIFLVVSASSQALVIETTDRGWYYSSGQHNESNENYSTGSFFSSDDEWRSFFVFDLSVLTSPVESAIFRFDVGGTDGSINSSGIFSVYDIATTSITNLRTSSTDDAATYTDLGNGVSYGSTIVSASSSFVDLMLNDDGLTALNNNLGGLFAFGGDLDYGLRIGGSTHNQGYTTQLLIADVSEPSNIAIFGIGLLGLVFARQRKA